MQDELSFTNDIQPIIKNFCSTCHQGKDPEGGLSLTNYAEVRKSVKEGDLLKRINDKKEPMPPSGHLPKYMRRMFKKWADSGYLNVGKHSTKDKRNDRLNYRKFTPPKINAVDVTQSGFDLLENMQGHWVGSMNFTTGGAYLDSNNLLRIRSQQLIENYQTEFDEMFIGDHFGPDTISDTPNPSIFVNGTMIETYFSPDDGVAEKIIDLLENANESIYFMAYSFTADDISNAILERASNGVTVAGVMDYSQIQSNGQYSEYDIFLQSGLDVRSDGIDGLLHHKVFIIDEEIVITGSYNFSASAEERNDENILIIYNSDIAEEFLKEFQRVQAQAQTGE